MGEITEKLTLKKRLREVCLEMQNRQVANTKEAMLRAQESANEEQGATEERFESFKEQMHIDREMYGNRMKEAIAALNQLVTIDVDKETNTARFGAVVITAAQKYFVSVSLGEVKLEGQSFFTISTSSPIFQAMNGKKKGESFAFRDKKVEILDIF